MQRKVRHFEERLARIVRSQTHSTLSTEEAELVREIVKTRSHNRDRDEDQMQSFDENVYVEQSRKKGNGERMTFEDTYHEPTTKKKETVWDLGQYRHNHTSPFKLHDPNKHDRVNNGHAPVDYTKADGHSMGIHDQSGKRDRMGFLIAPTSREYSLVKVQKENMRENKTTTSKFDSPSR